MQKAQYQVVLANPAFLGDASQNGTWRTPPLKALLREWWRVALAPDVRYEARSLKARESELFGTASDDGNGGSHQSRIRLALAHWNQGTLRDWPSSEPRVTHPEVKDRNSGNVKAVGTELYLGYGPLVFRQGTQLKNGAALQAGEANILKLAYPASHGGSLADAITLANWFGTIGGRSRNGWGSLGWLAQQGSPQLPALSRAALEQTGCVRPIARCLELDWAHAIGADNRGPLVWKSEAAFANWRDAMKFLAQTKISFRTSLGFTTGKAATRIEPRHVLAYPVTNHSVGAWGNNARIANTLRFKLHVETDGQMRALIYHTPCRPTLRHDGIDLLDTWARVHVRLDTQSHLARLS